MANLMVMYYTLPMILAQILNESSTPDYNVGLDASTVFNGMITLVRTNIVPILTLMGLALGMGWVIQYFNSARKGRLR